MLNPYSEQKDSLIYFISYVLLNIIFFYLLYRAVLEKNTIDGLAILLTSSLFTIILYIKTKKPIIFKYSLFLIITPLIIIPLQYYIHSIPQEVLVPNNVITIKQIFYMYVFNYSYGIPFLFVPYLIHNTKYDYKSFFNTITAFVIIYILYNIYIGEKISFNRDNLATYFKTLLTYDSIGITLIGVVYFYSLYFYTTNKNKWLGSLLFIIFLISLLLNITHGTRGTWLVIPIFIILTIINYRNFLKKISFSHIAIFISLIAFALLSKIDQITTRFTAAYSDIVLLQSHSNQATSIGSRIIMWEHAIKDFQSSPLIGISTFNVAEQVYQLNQQGLLAGRALTHMHSIYFQELASHGMIGLFALLFSFLSPLYFFFKFKTKNSREVLIKTTGIYVVICTMICGATDFYFITAVSAAVYYALTVTLLALLYKKN
ncbi:O-antigen ligase family protein [Acinetobacter sp. MD2(2019)]|uniref:O-antigen ligase family protein n=1 Tax=Acinetobacter sp. MD2(2019) TaxID=2605273 RepID=UPI002D1F4AD0|nr:O-antigen ligase family protein [Acinetobacter sp. MD2(2019)]MEB3754271.1 O-antigen ligase family protein [Acinetobacter sp. MD2(2019)]